MESVRFESVSPILAVHDLSQAIAFYRDVLGFELSWSWGEPAELAAMCRDGIEITLTCRADSSPVGTSHVYFGLSDVDACYGAIQRVGSTIVAPIGDRAYGMRDFRIADPSGNELGIGQPIAGDRAS